EKILEALATKEELSYEDCEQLLGVKAIHPILKSLVAKEAILIFEKVQEKYSPKLETRLRLHADYLSSTALEALFGDLQSKPKQEAILLKFLRDLPVHQRPELNAKGLPKASLLEAGDSESSLKTLIKNGILESFTQLVDRIPEEAAEREASALSEAQQEAMDQIKGHFESKQTVLLQGITGAGKTEIYIKLIQEALGSGSQVLLLLPEIALTTQLVGRLKQVFGSSMGVYHSKYSDNERV
ncbi:MAG: DEAD/DEAH box helicase family protein, partial [Algoriphagus sp.]|nr:DEAD/DEAH box helicase family protein [Algoriphagus sp.]